MFETKIVLFTSKEGRLLAHVNKHYGKCSKILNTFLLFSNKMLDIKVGIHKVLVRITNREDPDQTASSEAGRGQLVFEILQYLLY